LSYERRSLVTGLDDTGWPTLLANRRYAASACTKIDGHAISTGWWRAVDKPAPWRGTMTGSAAPEVTAMSVRLIAEAGIGVLVLLLLVFIVAMLRRPRTDLDRFEAARALTTRWSSDPSSAPAPIKDIARRARDNEDLVANG